MALQKEIIAFYQVSTPRTRGFVLNQSISNISQKTALFITGRTRESRMGWDFGSYLHHPGGARNPDQRSWNHTLSTGSWHFNTALLTGTRRWKPRAELRTTAFKTTASDQTSYTHVFTACCRTVALLGRGHRAPRDNGSRQHPRWFLISSTVALRDAFLSSQKPADRESATWG